MKHNKEIYESSKKFYLEHGWDEEQAEAQAMEDSEDLTELLDAFFSKEDLE